MSKNGANSNTSKNDQDQTNQPKVEHPKAAINRLKNEILDECRLISTGQKESCYTLVEKTRELMKNEDLVDLKKE